VYVCMWVRERDRDRECGCECVCGFGWVLSGCCQGVVRVLSGCCQSVVRGGDCSFTLRCCRMGGGRDFPCAFILKGLSGGCQGVVRGCQGFVRVLSGVVRVLSGCITMLRLQVSIQDTSALCKSIIKVG